MNITPVSRRRILNGIIVILAALPIIYMFSLLLKHSVNVYWWDQVSFIDLMTKQSNGTLSLHDLWVQHNEHRILVPQAIELFVGKLTGFNSRVFVFMNFATVLASFALLLSMLRRTFTNNSQMVFYLAVPFTWFLFSPIQWTNWIWGFQFVFFSGVFFAIATIWLLTHRDLLTNQKLFIGALVMASITPYCTGNGMLIWPIGLAILWWRRASRSKLLQWISVGAIVGASYLYNFHRAPESPQLSEVIKQPIAVIKYTLGGLGRSLATTPTSARYIGAVMTMAIIIAAVFIYKKNKLNNILGWLGLAAYGLLTVFLGSVSRLNFGVDHGYDSNSLPTVSMLFVLATLAVVVYSLTLWIKDFGRKKLKQYLLVFFLLGCFFSAVISPFIYNYTKGVEHLTALGQHMQRVQLCVYTAQSADDDCLEIIYPDKKHSWQKVEQLKALGWGDFSDDQN